ncbi:hypothetical protein ACFY0R_09965 [Streptomyces sp. NPDC001633]|uniref:hypothetical protein n=1 Tax=Streptomyces sp. NPDC001633 TaxID=3364595 RepID=UPI0036966DD3
MKKGEALISLQAPLFFEKVLGLPFDGRVIGNSYYARLGDGLRLRVDFYSTIRADEYGGIRARLLHPDKGTIDTVVLSFAEHDTFVGRDTRADCRPGDDGYGVLRLWNSSRAPWSGGDFTSLRQAVVEYVEVWDPAAAARHRASSTAQQARDIAKTPALPVQGGRRVR